STSRPPPQKPLDLDLTIISAKHLKNVNWKSGGDLKPYAVFWVDPDRRLSTKSDDSGSTRPVWNERFTLPITLPFHDSVLTLEIFHSKPSETLKPLVATLRVPIHDLPDPEDTSRIRTYVLTRPSGRPQGKIRVKMGIRERLFPDYHITPPPSYYYTSAPPPPARDYRAYAAPPYSAYPEAYPGYYPGYYSAAALPPPLPPRQLFERTGAYGGPSAPVDYSPYDQQKAKSGKMGGLGMGLGVGAVAGALGGLALEEGLKYEEEKIADRVESNLSSKEDYLDYRGEY
ncbi:C2 domain-containing protein, partial [Cephalotus follicularis]